MSKGGRYARKKTKKAFGWKYLLLILLVLLVVVTAAAVIYWNSMLNLMTKPKEAYYPTMSDEEIEAMLNPEGLKQEEIEVLLETAPIVEQTVPVSEEIVNIMLIGQQSRKGEEAKLSDTMILCTINRDTNTLTMTSFLRDLYVPLPAYDGHKAGRNRINVCYNLGSVWTGSSLGGMEMLALCIEQNFGIHIDHTIEVDFVGFEKIIDMLGGVEIEMTAAEASHLSRGGKSFVTGKNLLDGESALSYARLRSIDNDFGRTNRQRNVINSLLNKCRGMSLIELHNMATNILPLITTDMSNSDITGYLLDFLPMVTDLKVVSQTCPVDNEVVEGSFRYRTLEIAGVESHVIEPNLALNSDYLLKSLGLIE